MNTARTGLAFHPATPEFLKRAYGVSFVRDASGMSLYRDKQGKYFWGGWGSFYTVCMQGDSEAVLQQAQKLGKEYGLVEGCFSFDKDVLGARHVHPMLVIPPGISESSRMELYDGKTRNQTRRAREAPLQLVCERGKIPPDWYELYVETRRRLGSTPRGQEYFKTLEECFGDSLSCVVANDGSLIVGSTLYITHGSYVHLLDNVSRPSHWNMRVNNLVYDEMIRRSIVESVRIIDFGLTGAHDASHLDFKKGFGGVPWYLVSNTFGSPMQRALDIASRASRRIFGS